MIYDFAIGWHLDSLHWQNGMDYVLLAAQEELTGSLAFMARL